MDVFCMNMMTLNSRWLDTRIRTFVGLELLAEWWFFSSTRAPMVAAEVAIVGVECTGCSEMRVQTCLPT
jgi:hypothetical protein